jgi:hypothetical protein
MPSFSVPTRRFFQPTRTDDLREDAKPWVGKWVTVQSWHSLYSPYLRERYPNDEWVGFVMEFSGDIPESELLIHEPEMAVQP